MKVEYFRGIPRMYNRVLSAWDSDCADILESIRRTGSLEPCEAVASSFHNWIERWHGLDPSERGEWK